MSEDTVKIKLLESTLRSIKHFAKELLDRSSDGKDFDKEDIQDMLSTIIEMAESNKE